MVALGFAAGLAVAATSAAATDYFALDLRHAEFASEPLGPPAQFVPPAAMSAGIPVATMREPASTPVTQAIAASAHRVHTARVRDTAPTRGAHRPHRNPLSAFAAYPRPHNRPCSARSVCVFDGVNGRWHAP